MCCGVYSIPPQGPAFWDPKSEGSEGPYFPCTGDFVFLCTGALFSLYWGLIFPVLGPYFPCTGDFVFLCTGALFSLYWGLCISLYWGIIFPVLEPYFPVLGTLYFPCTGALFSLCWGLYVWYRYENGEKILEIFKGSEGPYRIETQGLGGGIL